MYCFALQQCGASFRVPKSPRKAWGSVKHTRWTRKKNAFCENGKAVACVTFSTSASSSSFSDTVLSDIVFRLLSNVSCRNYILPVACLRSRYLFAHLFVPYHFRRACEWCVREYMEKSRSMQGIVLRLLARFWDYLPNFETKGIVIGVEK